MSALFSSIHAGFHLVRRRGFEPLHVLRFYVCFWTLTNFLPTWSLFLIFLGKIFVKHICILEVFFVAELLIDLSGGRNVGVTHQLLSYLVRNTGVKKIGSIQVPELMGGHFGRPFVVSTYLSGLVFYFRMLFALFTQAQRAAVRVSSPHSFSNCTFKVWMIRFSSREM